MALEDNLIAEDTEAMDGEIATFPAPAITKRRLGPDRDQAEMLRRWSSPDTVNICDELLDTRDDADDLLGRIGQTVVRQYEIDQNSRTDWMSKSTKAIELASLVSSPKNTPWPGASNIIFPLIAGASLQFAARAYPGIVPGPDIVKGIILGDDEGVPAMDPQTGQPAVNPQTGEPIWQVKPGERFERAKRIAEHMSWQCLEEMEEWEEETDRLLAILPIVGCSFRKSFYDSVFDRNMAVLVLAENLVINYRAKSLETAPRITEECKLYPVEIEESQRGGLFLEHEYGPAMGDGQDEDAPHDFLEQHCRLDLDEDGYTEPYIVTAHKDTGKVARITARYEADSIKFSAATHRIVKIDPVHYYTKYDFLPNPDGGIYGYGFGQLLNPLNDSINSALNMLFDAGTLQNAGGGFIGKGLSMHAGSIRFKPGEYKVVNSVGRNIREAIVPFEHNGPSDTLFKLLGFLVEIGDRIASNTEVLSGQQSGANVPAATTLALIEQGLKVFTSVYKRIHRSLKKEFDKQKRLNTIYLDRESRYRRGDKWQTITQQDYIDGAGIEPISDPSMVSDMQQLVRAEFLKEFKDDPMCDGLEIRKRVFTAARLERVEDLVVKEPPPNPDHLFKAEELANKKIAARAQAISHVTGAIKNLAEVDKIGAQTHMVWLKAQMDFLEQEIEEMRNGQPGAQPGAGPEGGQGNIPDPVSAMAQPPGNADVPAIPAGLRQGFDGGGA